jgi:hypothetical protein
VVLLGDRQHRSLNYLLKIKLSIMAYYKITLDEMVEPQRLELLEILSTDLDLPIETSGEWRSRRTEPFLQLINEYIYIRHIKYLSEDERDELIGTANHLVDDYDTNTNYTVVVPNKVGSLTFKFFH